MENEFFVSERITKLRMDKGVSARDMSLSMGQNRNYINHIENRKAEPSLPGLMYICEYLGLTPQEFFDTGNQHPARLNDLIDGAKKLNGDELLHLSNFIKEMTASRK